MGRAGAAGASAAVVRALSPLRIGGAITNRRSSPKASSSSNRPDLSMARLRALQGQLATILDNASVGTREDEKASRKAGAKQKEARLIEIVRAIAELVAVGEVGNNPEFFEFFCEKAILSSFVRALRLGPAVQTQVVQAISILFQNLQSPTSLYMLLSQDHINRLIEPEAVGAELPMHDEEFVSNYVALLKAISVRLSKDTVRFCNEALHVLSHCVRTQLWDDRYRPYCDVLYQVQFFLNAQKGSFPLYSNTVLLIAHPDPMVRTSALNIILHVFSVDDPGVKAFLALEDNHGRFFVELSRLMQDAYSQVLCRLWQSRAPSAEQGSMEGSTGLFQDILYYIQDVLDASDPSMAARLAVHLHQTFFRPVVLDGLADAVVRKEAGGRQAAGTEEALAVQSDKEPEVQLALYAVCQFFLVVTHGPLLGLVATDLLVGSASSGDSGTETCRAAQGDDWTRRPTVAPTTEHLSTTDDETPTMPAQVVTAHDILEGRVTYRVCVPPAEISAMGAAPVETGRRLAERGAVAEVLLESGGDYCVTKHESPELAAGESKREGRGHSDVRSEAPDHFRYRRSLMVCMTQREAGQVRLAAIAAVRCLTRNALLKGGNKVLLSKSPAGAAPAMVESAVKASGSYEGIASPASRTLSAGSRAAREERVDRDGEFVAQNSVRGREETGVCICGGGVVNGQSVEAGLVGVSQAEVTSAATGGAPRTATAVLGIERERWARSEAFVELLGGLLRALGQHPVSRTVDVLTAAAAVGELVHLFSEVRLDVPPDASTEFRARTSAAAGDIDSTGGYRGDGGPWGLQSGPRERLFAAMLEEAYASSAAFEEAVVSFRVGFGDDVREAGGAQCFSPPPLPEVAAWGLLPEEWREGLLPAALRRADSGHERTVVRVQAYLVLRSLHEWLVEGIWSPLFPGQTTDILYSGIPGSIRLGADVLALAGEIDPPRRQPSGATTTALSSEVVGQTRTSPAPPVDCLFTPASFSASASERVRSPARNLNATADTAPAGGGRAGQGMSVLPSISERVQLSGLRIVACCLPHSWPGLSREFAPQADGSSTFQEGASSDGTENGRLRGGLALEGHGHAQRSPDSSSIARTTVIAGKAIVPTRPTATNVPANALSTHPLPRELYAVLDDESFILAAPDPTSIESGCVVCAASLRHTVARPHPADARVLEVRVSTRQGGGPGPGLLLPVVSAAAPGPGDYGPGETSFRGAGHRGLWHLVLVFETAAACSVVAEHVEEQREAVLAAQTVALVEMFRKSTELVESCIDGVVMS